MSTYRTKLLKTVTYTCEYELGEYSDEMAADEAACKLADDLNDSSKTPPAISWELEDEDVEAEEVWEE